MADLWGSGGGGGFGFPSPPKKKKQPAVADPGYFSKALSGIGSLLEIIDRPHRAITEGIATLGGVDKPNVGLSDILLHGKTGTTGRGLVDAAFGKLDKSTPWYDPSNIARAIGGFGLDVATDPITYLSLGTAPALDTAGLGAVKGAAEHIGETAARDAVNQSIEYGRPILETLANLGGKPLAESATQSAAKYGVNLATDVLGKKAGIRFAGRTVVPMTSIKAAGEATGLSNLGRRLAARPTAQALGERFIPGFVPQEVKAAGPEAVAKHQALYDLLRHGNRQADLAQVAAAKAVAEQTAGFTNDELRLVGKAIESPTVHDQLVRSGKLTPKVQDLIGQISEQGKTAIRAEQAAGFDITEKKNYLKHLLTSRGEKLSARSNLPRQYTGTIAETNAQAGKQIFEDIASIPHGVRMAESSKKLSQVETLQKILAGYADPLKSGEVFPQGMVFVRRQGNKLQELPESLFLNPHEYGTPKTIKSVTTDIGGTTIENKTLLAKARKAMDPNEYKVLKAQLAKAGQSPLTEAEMLQKSFNGVSIMPRTSLDLINKEMGFIPRDAVSKGRDKLLNLWKGYVYGVRPGAQARNAIWNTIMQGMAGERSFLRNGKTAADIMNGAEGGITTKLGETLDNAVVKKLAEEHGIIGHGYYGADEVSKVEDILRPAKGSYNPFSSNNIAIRTGKKAGTAVENNARLSLFIDRLIKGDTAEAATKVVNKHLFDYGELTKFEQNFMKRAVPFYCVPTDHEILTREGFKKMAALTIGEDVMGYDHETGELVWTPLEDVALFTYEGALKTFTRQGSKFLFTDDHRWPVETIRTFTKGKWYGGKRSILRTHELNTTHKIPLTGTYKEQSSVLSPRHAAILGWIVGDGYFRHRGKHCEMMVYQSPQKYLAEIIELLGTRPRKPHPDSGVVCVPVALADVKELRKVFSVKSDLPGIVGRLSAEAALAMWDALFKAEGCTTPATGQQGFAQCPEYNPEVLEAFQILTLLIGKTANLSSRGLYVRTSRYVTVKEGIGEEVYVGSIWCPKTKYGTWVMRHDGAMMITGNTFARKNVPLQMKLVTEHPGAYAALGKAKAAIESLSPTPNEKYLPDYLTRGNAVRTPFKQNGKPLYWNSNLGFENIKLPLQPQELFSMLSPEVKAITELLTNRNVYYGKPIEKYPGQKVAAPEVLGKLPEPIKGLLGIEKGKGPYYTGKAVMSPTNKYMLDQVPLSRDILKIAAGNEKSPLSALALLLGLRLTPYDPQLAQDIALGTRKKKKKVAGGPLGF